MLQEEQRSVINARQAGAETAGEAELFVLALDFTLLLLPIHAEGRVGQEVIEGLARELVLGEAVAVLDVICAAVVIHLFDEHVGGGCGKGTLIVILAVNVEARGGVVLAEVILGLGEHAAGAAGRIEQLANRAGCGQQLVIVDEENADHQPHDLARREVIAGGFVGQFVEPPDEVLEDQPHLLVGHAVRVKVDFAELRDD